MSREEARRQEMLPDTLSGRMSDRVGETGVRDKGRDGTSHRLEIRGVDEETAAPVADLILDPSDASADDRALTITAAAAAAGRPSPRVDNLSEDRGTLGIIDDPCCIGPNQEQMRVEISLHVLREAPQHTNVVLESVPP